MTEEELINKLKLECEQLRFNAQRAGKEGAGTHRNAGDSGRVVALWIEKLQELKGVTYIAGHDANGKMDNDLFDTLNKG